MLGCLAMVLQNEAPSSLLAAMMRIAIDNESIASATWQLAIDKQDRGTQLSMSSEVDLLSRGPLGPD